MGNIGIVYQKLGEYQKAIQFYEQALEILRRVEDVQGESNTLNCLGSAFCSMGEYLKAIEFHERSLEIAQRIKDAQGEKSALSNIGFAYKYLGEYNKAIEFHEKSLEIAQRIGDVKGEAVELKVISIIHDSMKKNEKAGQTVNHDRAHITGPGLPHLMGLIGVFFIEPTEFPSLFDGLLLGGQQK